jgi:hypothetical protein
MVTEDLKVFMQLGIGTSPFSYKVFMSIPCNAQSLTTLLSKKHLIAINLQK